MKDLNQILSSGIWHKGVSGNEKWQEFGIPPAQIERLRKDLLKWAEELCEAVIPKELPENAADDENWNEDIPIHRNIGYNQAIKNMRTKLKQLLKEGDS